MIHKFIITFLCMCLFGSNITGQSIFYNTYMNPVIPGDHPDPTLTKIGNDFYTSGSSFNPTPKIYHSTDLVHWEVIAQPVSETWSGYGDSPGEGIWGGHMVFHNNIYWHYFGRGGGSMYFVTAYKPEGPWSNPIRVNVPTGINSLGVDNSIFIDADNKWYMLTKAGRENNYIIELDNNGQPNGNILDLTWLNPDSEGNPYGWAEGPVMWKANGYYYYSFAQHLAGNQYVMRSNSLTDEESAWTIIGNNIFTGSSGNYSKLNHISPVVLLEDSTSWVIAHSYLNDWYAHGRQGLLCRVKYNEDGFPVIQNPSEDAVEAPNLPSGSIKWMVPHSDSFESTSLNPEWSFLGYTAKSTYSLLERPGWIKLSPARRLATNTIIKNDGEHNYSLITQVDFEPEVNSDEAGLWIINGPETLTAKVYVTINSVGKNVFAFTFENTTYEVENTIGSIVWLKLIRNEHQISGFFSTNGFKWIQIGDYINARNIDSEQTQFNDFTGNKQGLYIKNKSAYFNNYIYRDAYTYISAGIPVNQSGTKIFNNRYPPNSLSDINNNDWALYAGVEFGNSDYLKHPDSIKILASSISSGGIVEVWLDSLTSANKISECQVTNTGDYETYKTFVASIDKEVTGNHDVYLKFIGSNLDELFRLRSINFIDKDTIVTKVKDEKTGQIPFEYGLDQNFPNPFNPVTTISYQLKKGGNVNLSIYDTLGRKIKNLVNEYKDIGYHTIKFDASKFTSGIYFYKINAGSFSSTKKFVLLK